MERTTTRPLTRPEGTLSPDWGEGWGEGTAWIFLPFLINISYERLVEAESGKFRIMMCKRTKPLRRRQFQISNFLVSLLNIPPVTMPLDPKAKKFHPRSLLGVLAFLRRYPGRVTLCLGLLLVNIAIEMTLPQILGNAITGLRAHVSGRRGIFR